MLKEAARRQPGHTPPCLALCQPWGTYINPFPSPYQKWDDSRSSPLQKRIEYLHKITSPAPRIEYLHSTNKS